MSKGQQVSKAEALEDLKRVADELGRPPKKQEYTELGKYHGDTPARRCDGWIDALRQAGLDPGDRMIEGNPAERLPKGNGQRTGFAPNPGTHAHVLESMTVDEFDEILSRRRAD